ncbi:hypothetical protein K437DRAFT_268819 [Tilletiaria anomala UBC 951]|uniref:Homeobox domain-containing protein n=1 Tax=Tilletiaria anomala (strain ATCC 24038 / CBS 436.72 / UBC 951) TaxID=1037660 RepID=A0A066W0U8_TILAU|nr:uncharacterized protein K437DRAFT_268819 [Tilletiaria anomala UBC 951]KDN44395.1 hypothetical protein K437DRAFT_268819 [Tilletiaria anomala UBC 951]
MLNESTAIIRLLKELREALAQSAEHDNLQPLDNQEHMGHLPSRRTSTANIWASQLSLAKKDLQSRLLQTRLQPHEISELLRVFSAHAADAITSLTIADQAMYRVLYPSPAASARSPHETSLRFLYQQWLDQEVSTIMATVRQNMCTKPFSHISSSRRLHEESAIQILEYAFSHCSESVTAAERQWLAEIIGCLNERQVMIWFQNRRHRGGSRRSSIHSTLRSFSPSTEDGDTSSEPQSSAMSPKLSAPNQAIESTTDSPMTRPSVAQEGFADQEWLTVPISVHGDTPGAPLEFAFFMDALGLPSSTDVQMHAN